MVDYGLCLIVRLDECYFTMNHLGVHTEKILFGLKEDVFEIRFDLLGLFTEIQVLEMVRNMSTRAILSMSLL